MRIIPGRDPMLPKSPRSISQRGDFNNRDIISMGISFDFALVYSGGAKMLDLQTLNDLSNNRVSS